MEKIINLGAVAHQLRTPLNGILGFAHLLAESYRDLSDTEKLEYINIIMQSGEKLLTLLDELMEMETLSSSPAVTLSPVNIHHEVQRAISSTMYQIVVKSLTVEEEETDVIINSNAGMINFILSNLITNAVKFSYHDNKILVSTETTTLDGEPCLQISVSDNGRGMSKELIDKLFVEIVTKPGVDEEHGNGIGLINCMHLIKKLGGKIWVESEEGKGSKFTFSIPFP